MRAHPIRFALVVTLLWSPGALLAQVQVDITRSCALYAHGIRDAIYAFRPDQSTETTFRRIADFVGMSGDIKLLAANVPSVLAVIEGDARYVLYNTDFTYPAERDSDHDLRVLAMLSHNIAHHALEHSLPGEDDRYGDELEADWFAGQLVAQLVDDKDRALGQLQRSMVLLVSDIGPDVAERRRALLAGWRDADEELATAPGTSYETGGGADAFPELPWPPPRSSARVRLPLDLESPGATLADVASHLEMAFYSAGYGDFSYLSVPDGFAMVSQLEQINPDGTPLPVPDRWSARVRPFREFSLANYVRALFRATPGNFRIVVFVVTPRPFSASGAEVASDEAAAWLAQGLDALPPQIARLPVSADTKTSALIYEFVKPTRDDEAEYRAPGTLPAMDHLRHAGLWDSLGL